MKDIAEPTDTEVELDGWGIPEANTPDGLIPGSYLEGGIRKIIVWDESEDHEYLYKDGLLIERSIF